VLALAICIAWLSLLLALRPKASVRGMLGRGQVIGNGAEG